MCVNSDNQKGSHRERGEKEEEEEERENGASAQKWSCLSEEFNNSSNYCNYYLSLKKKDTDLM